MVYIWFISVRLDEWFTVGLLAEICITCLRLGEWFKVGLLIEGWITSVGFGV